MHQSGLDEVESDETTLQDDRLSSSSSDDASDDESSQFNQFNDTIVHMDGEREQRDEDQVNIQHL